MAGGSGETRRGNWEVSEGRLRVGVVGSHSSRVATIAAEIEAAGIPVAAEARTAKELGERLDDGAGSVVVHCCPASAAKARAQLFGTKRAFGRSAVVALLPVSAEDGVGRVAREVSVDGVVHAQELEALVPTVLAVGAGQVVVPRAQYRRETPAALSHRERQVLRLAVSGRTNDSIARELYLSCSTVKSHLTSAFAKLSVRSRREAAVLLLDPEQPASRLVFSKFDEDVALPETETVGGATI
jgi:DNA-binding NarL/FixJ family response regulator